MAQGKWKTCCLIKPKSNHNTKHITTHTIPANHTTHCSQYQTPQTQSCTKHRKHIASQYTAAEYLQVTQHTASQYQTTQTHSCTKPRNTKLKIHSYRIPANIPHTASQYLLTHHTQLHNTCQHTTHSYKYLLTGTPHKKNNYTWSHNIKHKYFI